jgi:two-component system, NarL family, sensor histidine kinase DegS
MYDNNSIKDNSKDDIEDRKTSCLLLRDLAVDLEEQLFSVKMQLKTQENLVKEKDQELKERERTKDNNKNLFYPKNNQNSDTNDLITEIEKIRSKIIELENNQNMLNCKIKGLKSAAKFIDSIDKSSDSKESESIPKLTDKGLGILEAQEIERQRIARDLHDTTVQNLTSLVHKAELSIKLIDIDTIRSKLELSNMSNTLKMVINDMRGIIYNLKPMTLDDLGLTITIQRYANRIINYNNIQVKVTSNEEPKEILSVIKLTIFRIIQEACNNIIKHANATFVTIDINYLESNINVTIKDNGIGFYLDQIKSSEQSSSFGLSIMKERILLLSGSLDIKSEKNKGTAVFLTVPLTLYEGGIK